MNCGNFHPSPHKSRLEIVTVVNVIFASSSTNLATYNIEYPKDIYQALWQLLSLMYLDDFVLVRHFSFFASFCLFVSVMYNVILLWLFDMFNEEGRRKKTWPKGSVVIIISALSTCHTFCFYNAAIPLPTIRLSDLQSTLSLSFFVSLTNIPHGIFRRPPIRRDYRRSRSYGKLCSVPAGQKRPQNSPPRAIRLPPPPWLFPRRVTYHTRHLPGGLLLHHGFRVSSVMGSGPVRDRIQSPFPNSAVRHGP